MEENNGLLPPEELSLLNMQASLEQSVEIAELKVRVDACTKIIHDLQPYLAEMAQTLDLLLAKITKLENRLRDRDEGF
jgi:uncharacterized coiled-coil protein SlyX